MKLASLAILVIKFILCALGTAPQQEYLTYAQEYSDPNTRVDGPGPVNACSSFFSSYGMHILAQVPNYPYLGGFNEVPCGTCYNITYPSTGITIYVTVVDHTGDGFVVSEDAMDTLTQSPSPGTKIDVLATQADPIVYCGAPWQ